MRESLVFIRYKKILQTANKWEYDLIEPQIDKIDEVLKVGEETLTWKNEQGKLILAMCSFLSL